MSSGLFEMRYNPVRIASTCTDNISGGVFRVGYYFSATYANTFQPSGGEVEVTDDYGSGIVYCSNGNYFHHLRINGNTNTNTDLTITNNLIINTGTFNVNGYTVDVDGHVFIYDTMQMTNAADVLNCFSIYWYSGSSDNITNGEINVLEDWYFNNSTDAQLGTGNTVNFVGMEYSSIYCYDADAEFGNLNSDKALSYTEIHSSNTQPTRVSGNFEVSEANLAVHNSLIVDGNSTISNGASVDVELDGVFTNNSDFDLDGALYNFGSTTINSDFDISSTGELVIFSGSLINDSNSPVYFNGTLSMSDGLFETHGHLTLDTGAVSSVSGGIIRVNQFFAPISGSFEPTGGTVELFNYSGVVSQLRCYNGNYFYNLKINRSSSSVSVYIDDIIVQNDLDITSGYFELNGHDVTVNNNLSIYGSLRMDDSSDILNIGNVMNWFSGSFADITNGNINISGDWNFHDGTYIQMGTGNTVNFVGTETQLIYCNDENAAFGNVTIDQSGYPIYAIWLDGSSSYDIQVAGDFTVEPDNIFQVSTEMLTIDGTLDIKNNGKMYLEHAGGELINNSDFNLNGELEIDGGDFLLHGEFDLETTGTLTIDSGSFIDDKEYYTGSSATRTMNGSFNLSNGLFEVMYNNLTFGEFCSTNISGGIIRVGHFFGTFEHKLNPSGGELDLNSFAAWVPLNPALGNSFHDLRISNSIYLLNSEILINGNLYMDAALNLNSKMIDVSDNVYVNDMLKMIATSDGLNIGNDIFWNSGSSDEITNGEIIVYGDWYFNSGTSAQLGTGNTVNFAGSENSYIYCYDDDACFGNLVVDKDTTSNIVEIYETARVAGDLDVSTGYLLMGDLVNLEIGISLNVNSGAELVTIVNDDAPTITKYGTGYYSFNVESGGTVDVSSTIFEYMSTNGMNIKSGAIIDGSSLLSNCTFRNGETGGTLLTIDNNQTLTLDGLSFNAGSRDAMYNVTKNVNVGEITFTNSSGVFDGPDYENDSYNHLHWNGFTTPSVTTDEISEINQNTATGGGDVTADGGCSVTAKGVCWSVSANPTIADNFTTDGTGTGVFVSSLTDLDSDTHYYVRSYTTNILGTAYGNEVTFTTLENVTPPNSPENLIIEISEDYVVLTWDAVAGADSYKVYSSDDPDTLPENWILEEENVTDLTWSEPIPASNRFYYVTTNSGIIRNSMMK